MLRATAVVAITLTAGSAAAQTTSAVPGPWALDVHGVTSPVPTAGGFYPPVGDAVLVPTRGYGFDIGAHVYLLTLGPSRVGFGASVMNVTSAASPSQSTGSPPSAVERLTMNVRVISPQVSFNFGSRGGWSYLSAGAGVSRITGGAEGLLQNQRQSDALPSLNFGGGARWFMKQRLAFGFDLRAHMIGSGAATPRVTLFAVGAGLSLR